MILLLKTNSVRNKSDKNGLNNKTWRCSKCKKTASKRLGYFFRIEIRIRNWDKLFLERERKNIRFYRGAKGKFAGKTMVRIVVTMADLCFVSGIFMMALFLGKGFLDMIIRVYRL